MEPNTLEERCNWQHRIISWLSMVGSLTVLGAFLSLLGEIPGFKGYYLFEWLILPSSPTGYFVAIGIATVCQLLPRGLPWWRMALAGAGTGAVFGVLGGLDTLNLNLQFENSGLRVVTRWKMKSESTAR